MWVNKHAQGGAALLEFAIALCLFLLLVFGIMQLCLSYFAWNQVSEAARDGARFLEANSPVADLSGQDCSAAAPAAVSVSCGGGSCGALMGRIQAQAPFVTSTQVRVSYTCSTTGNSAAPTSYRVRSINLTISGVPNSLVIGGLAGLGWTQAATLPTVSVTRNGEAMYTPTP